MTSSLEQSVDVANKSLPPHLSAWQLPRGWVWGSESLAYGFRHYQQVCDVLGRSLALVTSPYEEHLPWLEAEAKALAQYDHPTIPTTYHYWVAGDSARGPGYLRRWVIGQMVAQHLERTGPLPISEVLRILRMASSAVAHIHNHGRVHGAIGPASLWLTPTERLWMLGWQWALPQDIIDFYEPTSPWLPRAPEWSKAWRPTQKSDQWQLGALAIALLSGRPAPDGAGLSDLPNNCPGPISDIVSRLLESDPEERYSDISEFVRALDQATGRKTILVGKGAENVPAEARLRAAVGDDYEVLAALGAGAFGSVWRVRDLALDREVAMKMLHSWVAQDTAQVATFRREAQVAARLEHAGIVPIYDWEHRGGVVWYTMALAEGGSLAERVRRDGPLSLGSVAKHVWLLLDALSAAHSAGIVHRDIKPANVLIDANGVWRLADFGLARSSIHGGAGTPAFAAPEQMLGESHGPSVDIYGLAGVIAYALTGRPPFGDGAPEVVLSRQLTQKPYLAGIEPGLAEWCEAALAPDPSLRPSSAEQMRLEWLSLMDALEIV